jgi:hypothetical protein
LGAWASDSPLNGGSVKDLTPKAHN